MIQELLHPHAFFATRKGTPKGISGNWWEYCDECGGRMEDPQHRVTQEVSEQAILNAIAGAPDD